MEMALALPMKIEISDVFAKDLMPDPVKVHCMSSLPMGTPLTPGGPQAKKRVHWGPQEDIARGAPVVDQGLLLPVGRPQSVGKDPAKEEASRGQSLQDPRCPTASKQDGEAPRLTIPASQPAKLGFPKGVRGAPLLGALEVRRSSLSSEEESTACSGSDPDAAASSADDDSSSGSEELPMGKSRSEPLPARRATQVPQPPPGIPSVGSALHGTGMCRPCSWYWKPDGCVNKEGCRHCHLCPRTELKTRKKSKILMMRMGLATPKAMAASMGSPDMEGHTQSMSPFGFCMQGDGSPARGLALPAPSWPDSVPTVGAPRLVEAPCPPMAEGAWDVQAAPLPSPAGLQGSIAVQMGALRLVEAPCPPTPEGAWDVQGPITVQMGDPRLVEARCPPTPKSARDVPVAPLPSPPGLQVPAGVPSRGSALHSTGECKPCAWFWKPGGCQKEQDCMHCHLCPEGEVKARKMAKLSMMRQNAAGVKNTP